VLSGSLFCVTGSDSDGDAISAMSDRVRYDNSTQNA
jgi:hypothetical protein